MALTDTLCRLYAEAASSRRRWYARRPDVRRQLARPVVSIGNLRVGGTGKTPVVRHVAEVLLSLGERPAILSRGYGRRRPDAGVVVVSDGVRLRADLDRAGDEPLMLARALPGAGVFVSPDRALAGVLAERRFGATVHLLDDGFQHFAVARDADVLLVAVADLDDRTLPFGRQRERWDAVSAADALVVVDDHAASLAAILDRAGPLFGRAPSGTASPVFTLRREIGAARLLDGTGTVEPGAAPAMLVAGIARPERFRDDLRRAGWRLAGERLFGDHERFSRATLAAIAEAAAACGAALVLTTEKDAVRMLTFRPLPVPTAWIPLAVTIEPVEVFRDWLSNRVGLTRDRRDSRNRAGVEALT